jgi:Ca-activated chloride channel family protein
MLWTKKVLDALLKPNVPYPPKEYVIMKLNQKLAYVGLFIILTSVVLIIVLGFIGPAVGNVFSGIVSNYGGATGSYTSYATSPPYDPGSTYGGTNPVNDEPYRDMFFENYGVNPFIDTEDDPLSTFALDVDTGSYTIVRNYLQDGNLPPKEAIRVEEFINYFDMHYPPPEGDTFAIYLDGGPTPFVQNERYQVIRIGIQGMQISEESRKEAVLTFVIDVSGSMADGNRLEMVKSALATMVQNLRPRDQVGIVIYDDTASVLLPMSPVSERETILDAISKLQPRNSTNAEAGLKLGYQMANNAYTAGAINRVILCSDGVANVGVTGHEGILESIQDSAEGGITLTTVGVGLGNYNDVLMEQLADEGDGFYTYVDTFDQAEKLFAQNLTSTLQTIAMDAKVQMAFNPEVVSRYRLIGYENRSMKDEEFEDASADAGEIGVGHNVTALYEIKLVEGASGEIATVSLRWKDPDSLASQTLTASIDAADLTPSFESTSPSFQVAVLVAEFAEILRESYWAQEVTIRDLQQVIKGLDSDLLKDPEVAEFAQLAQQAEYIAEEPVTFSLKPQPTSDLPTPIWPEPTPVIIPTQTWPEPTPVLFSTPTPVSLPLPTTLPTGPEEGYDYSEEEPIRVGGGPDHGPWREEWYFESLQGPQGQLVEFHRIGSCCSFDLLESPWGTGALDIYEVIYEGLDEPRHLYIDMYQCEAPAAPQGFTFEPDFPVSQGRLFFPSASNFLVDDLSSNLFTFDGETECLYRLPVEIINGWPIAISPDGQKVAFSWSEGEGIEHLMISNLDGSERIQLTYEETIDVFPAWSPDGDTLAFVRSDTVNAHIHLLSLETGEVSRLTDGESIEIWPSWSPDGSRIAFSSDREGGEEIFLINRDGTGLTQLTDNVDIDMTPAWSPNGKHILFTSDRDGSYDIYRMEVDGSNVIQLTDTESFDFYPTWSPDGQQIAFCSGDINADIYVMNADGSGLLRLTEASSMDCFPVWVE